MSNLFEELGKVAGAVMAEQGVAKLDPDANFLEKAAAAIAGFEGAKLAENAAEEKYQQYKESEQLDSQDRDNQTDYQAEANDNNTDDSQNDNQDDDQSDNS